MVKRLLEHSDLDKVVLVSSPSIERSGRKALFTVTRINIEKDRYDSTIWIADLDSRTYETVLNGPTDICPLWSPDGSRFVFQSRRGLGDQDKGSELYLMRSIDSEPWKVAYFKGGIQEVKWNPDSRRLLVISKVGEIHEDVKIIERIPIWRNAEGFTYNLFRHVFIVDTLSGLVTQATEGNINVSTASWSPDGSKIAYAASVEELKPYVSRVYILDTRSGEKSELPIQGFSITSLTWSTDGSKIAFLGREIEKGRTFASHFKVFVYDLSSQELSCVSCYRDEELNRNTENTLNSDVRGPSCSPHLHWGEDGYIYYMISDGGRVKLYRSRPGGEPTPVIDLPRFSVDEFSVDAKGRNIVFTAMSSFEPKELYVYSGGEVGKLTEFNKGFLEVFDIGRPRYFRFKASDGKEIDGWILMPPESAVKENKKIPWILYIHGGPKTMYGEGFLFEFHLLSHKGFAVVYTNPRGSDGYSEEFADIRCRFGERDYQDLMEAVDYVLKEFGDRLDPVNIGVAGGSYGGFMTNWIVTHTDRFKAALTERSISDWISKFGTTDIGFYFNAGQIGCGKTPWEDPDTYLAKSPVMHVKNAKTPTLIIHSVEDYRCWLDQAIEFFTALKLNGVKTKLVIFPGENHELSRSGKPKHRVERLKIIVEWFKENLYG